MKIVQKELTIKVAQLSTTTCECEAVVFHSMVREEMEGSMVVAWVPPSAPVGQGTAFQPFSTPCRSCKL
jgi:hypothetical protein